MISKSQIRLHREQLSISLVKPVHHRSEYKPQTFVKYFSMAFGDHLSLNRNKFKSKIKHRATNISYQNEILVKDKFGIHILHE